MEGREDKKANDLFFTCSLIEYLGRKTKNRRSDIVRALGKKEISRIYELADVYHSDNIERVSDDFIEKCHIVQGSYDNVSECMYSIPSHWDIGKIYKRLILGVAKERGADVVDTLIEVYSSFIEKYIDDYNSSFYYENPQYILACYLEQKILD